MKKIIASISSFVLLSVLLTGCFLQAVHPLVHHTDSELAPGLEGVWEGEDSRWYFINDMNNFRKYLGSKDRPYTKNSIGQGGTSYFVFFKTLEDDSDTTMFIGATIELNGNYYLDLYPTDKSIKEYELIDYHMFPVHTFSRIDIRNNQLSIEFFEDEWIRDQLNNNRVRLKHEKLGSLGQGILITASTEELQKFVIKYGNEPKAYDEPLKLQRIK